MSNILFDRQTLKVVGSNRSPLPFEVEVKDIDLSDLPIKTITEIHKYYVTEDKKDENGNQLYYFTFTIGEDDGDLVEDVEEITEESVYWNYNLPKVTVEVEKSEQTTRNSTFEDFTYQEVVELKQSKITKGTFFGQGILFEDMDEATFSTNLSSFQADLGFGFISLPSGGEVRTVKLALPLSTDLVGLKLETSAEGIKVFIGDTASNLLEVADNERYFDEKVSEVYVKFENPTDKRIDIYSFALLV